MRRRVFFQGPGKQLLKGFTTTIIEEKEKSDGPQLLVEQEQLKKAAEINERKEALPTNYFLPDFNIPRKEKQRQTASKL